MRELRSSSQQETVAVKKGPGVIMIGGIVFGSDGTLHLFAH